MWSGGCAMLNKLSFVFCNWKVWSFGIVVDFEYPYVGIGLGPFVIRYGIDRVLE